MRWIGILMILSLAGCGSKDDDKDGDGEVASSPSPPGNRTTPDREEDREVVDVVVTETIEGQVKVEVVLDDDTTEVIYEEVVDDPVVDVVVDDQGSDEVDETSEECPHTKKPKRAKPNKDKEKCNGHVCN